jgi:hypothetical protein
MTATKYPDCEAVMASIERFRNFLNSAWPALTEVLGEHDWDDDAYFLEDWLDANWNLLVCRQLLGKGSVLQPFAIATNEINKGNYSHRLESMGDRKLFVSLGSGEEFFEFAPPFDKVKVMSQSGVTEVVPWPSLQFELKRIS